MPQPLKQVLEFTTIGGEKVRAEIKLMDEDYKKFKKTAEEPVAAGGDQFDRLGTSVSKASSAVSSSTSHISSAFHNLGTSIERVGLYQVGLDRQLTTSAINIGHLGAAIGGVGSGLVETGQKTGGPIGALEILVGWMGTVITRSAELTAGIAAAGAAVLALGSHAGKTVDALATMADKAGVSLKTFQDLTAAGAAKGVGTEAMASGMTRLRDEALRAAGAYTELTQKIEASRDLQTGEIKDKKLAAEAHDLYTSKISKSMSILEKIGVSIRGFSGTEAETEQLFRSLVSAIADLSGRGTQEANLRLKELKSALGPDFVRVAAMGSAAIAKFGAEVDKMAPKIKDPLKAQEQQQKLNLLKEALGRVGTQLQLAFLPAAIKGGNFLTEWLTNNQASIKEIEGTFANLGKSVVNFFKILEGDEKAKKESPWVNQMIEAFGKARDKISEYATKAESLLPKVGKIAEDVAKAINKAFGTGLQGSDVILLTIIGRMVGAFGILYEAIKFAFLNPAITLFTASFITMFAYFDKFTILGSKIHANLVLPLEKAATWAQKLYGYSTFQMPIVNAADKELKRIKEEQKAYDDLIASREKNDPYKNMSTKDAYVARMKDAMTTLADATAEVWRTATANQNAGMDSMEARINALREMAKGAVGTSNPEAAGSTLVGTSNEAKQTAQNMDAVTSATQKTNAELTRTRDLVFEIDKISKNMGPKATYNEVTRPSAIELSPMASGGAVVGPGTATSDSIPAWLSAGEFVVRAAAVAKYGVGLFHQLNGMRLSGGGLFRNHFADGGLATAGGFSAPEGSSARGLTLVLDGKSYGGFSGSPSVVDQLERHAASRRLSSTTKRVPSRVG